VGLGFDRKQAIDLAAREYHDKPKLLLRHHAKVVSVKFCKKGIDGMWLDEIKRFMGRVKGGGEAQCCLTLSH